MIMLDFRDYIAFAEKQVMLAEEQISRSSDANWALIPAIILAWSAIESFINNRLDDFATLPESVLQLHERAFLLEKRIRLEDSGDQSGHFVLEGTEYNRLEDKIQFLVAKFGRRGKNKVPKDDALWQGFQEFKSTRDFLVHPRQGREVAVSVEKAREFIQTSKEVIQLVSKRIWNKDVKF